jgi:hypothetical protein
MKLGVELLGNIAFHFIPGTYFLSGIQREEKFIENSLGRDDYLENGMVAAGKRIAATGREAAYTAAQYPTGNGLGALDATPATVVDLGDSTEGIQFYLKCNKILDPGILNSDFALQVVLENSVRREEKICLNSPGIRVNWLGRGEFLVDLDKILYDLL